MAEPAVPAEIFDHNTAILGRTGSGKSYAARGIAEGWLKAGRRVCIVDPTDVWYGLRANAAGTGPGFPVVVFGGEHGDVPLGERSGERVAEIVASRNLPAIIATAEMTVGERHRFMTGFLGTLYRRNRAPLHLVLDEADDVAPQNPLPENRRMLGDVERIVRRGRVRGFRVTMISQRSAVLNKNILSQASVLVAMRMPAKQDRDAIQGWIQGQADSAEAAQVLGSLSRLQRGEGWIWAPEQGVLLRQTFPAIATFDSMRAPAFGETLAEPSRLAPVELGELRALLAAEGPSNEGANEMAKINTGARKAEREAAQHRGYDDGYKEGRLAGQAALAAELLQQFDEVRAEHARAAHAVGEVFAQFLDRLEPALLQTRAGAKRDFGDIEPAPPSIREAAGGNGSLPSSGAKMLGVLARGVALTWPQTATLAGLKARGGHFNAGRKALRGRGYIEEAGELVHATAAGYAAAGGRQPAPATPEEALAWWRQVLPQTPARVLDQLYRQRRWIGRDRLAEFLRLAPRGGHWNGAIAILRQNRLIEIRGDELRIAAEAFRPGDG
jgi:uncharacterized protein